MAQSFDHQSSHFSSAFDEIFFGTLPAGEIPPTERARLETAAASLLALATSRQPGRALIEIDAPASAIYIVNDDMPFLVDSVTAALRALNLEIDRVVHPIYGVERDAAGRLTALGKAGTGAVTESMMVVRLRTTALMPPNLAALLAAILEDVRVVVGDWPVMRQAMQGTQALLPADSEEAQFLEWLQDGHFTFLGAGSFELSANRNSVPLGLLRPGHLEQFEAQAAGLATGSESLIVSKTALLSPVHRHVPMDVVTVRDPASGTLHVFLGIFTSRAYNQSSHLIPLLRHKVGRVLERAGFLPSSHNYKLVSHTLDTYPRDELFRISEEELLEAALQLVALEDRPRFAMFARRDSLGQIVSLMLYMPRESYEYALRQRLEQAALRLVPGALHFLGSQATSASDHLSRIHLTLAVDPAAAASFDAKAIGAGLRREFGGWRGRLVQELTEKLGEPALAERYAQAFPSPYRREVEPEEAIVDLHAIESLLAAGDKMPRLYVARQAVGEQPAVLSLLRVERPLALSDLMPILKRLGFRVFTETAFKIEPVGAPVVSLQRLAVELPAGYDLAANAALLSEAFGMIWERSAESDALNRLILAQGLSMRQVSVLRGLTKYLRQTQFRFTQEAVEAAFATYPRFGRLLIDLFEAEHNPARASAESIAQLRAEIAKALSGVANADDDAILRAYLTLLQGMLRTNYYQRDAHGQVKPALAFKFRSKDIAAFLPAPLPWVEMFVYSPRFEAVHLRCGPIARGGIRWSDRREDFRTEILGLMKAQMVKNTVIVPVGSKGGFVCKRPAPSGVTPEERQAAVQAEGIACYRLMVHSMLDITDNYAADGSVIPVEAVVRKDGDDPYFVVAADKGTATFSDIANAVSQERGFWLDDAFASGGSSGYDHKKMGITSRGAWESVKRHFRELGIDSQKDPITVVGVGDMSGDVFGNGLLRSHSVRLLGAFDHRHIFVDPNPIAEISFAERQRLFDLPSSSWDDYDKALLSAGGMVYSRAAKLLDLTPEIRAAFSIDEEQISPNDLIRILLKAQVDLLFFGGIGTYVKAPEETHAEVGDRASEPLRIDGSEIRAAVVAEGANLAMTQKGRIAYAVKGGRINTDFIDNSAGVDTSDHEVNIKVLLKPLLEKGDLVLPARDALLASMTDEVASLVLMDNYQQTQTLSRLEARAAASLEGDMRFMRDLERQGFLDRVVENLPDDEELAGRAAAGKGLTRPELAVLLAYGKITAYDPLVRSPYTPPGFSQELAAYFPQKLQQDYAAAIPQHRLGREIVMTRLVNALVNRGGPTFVHEMEIRTGAPLGEIFDAFLRVRAAFDLETVWGEIEALDGRVSAAEQTGMQLVTEALLSRVVPRVLSQGKAGEAVDTAADREAVQALMQVVMAGRPASAMTGATQLTLGQRLALFPALTPALDLVGLYKEMAVSGAADLKILAKTHAEAGKRFGLSWLTGAAATLPPASDWERRAIDALLDEAFDLTLELVRAVIATDALPHRVTKAETRAGPQGAVSRFAQHWTKETTRLDAVLTEAMAAPVPNLALLNFVAAEVRRLVRVARG
jgi:glutamate dehydrogenase